MTCRFFIAILNKIHFLGYTSIVQLPEFFKTVLWSSDFSQLSPEDHIHEIVVNTINYGEWQHWQWLIDYYGEKKIGSVVKEASLSEFRKPALKLARILWGLPYPRYETRSDRIRAKKGLH